MGERSQPSHLPVSGGLHAQRQRKQAPPSFSAFPGGPSDDEPGSLFPRHRGKALPLQSAPINPLLSPLVVPDEASPSHARHDIAPSPTAGDGEAPVHPIESKIVIPIKPGPIKHDDDTEKKIKLLDSHQQSIIRYYTSDCAGLQKRIFDLIWERRSQSPSQDICEVERDSITGGIQRVRYASDIPSNCPLFEGKNALRRFAKHFVHNHLGVKEPFVCYEVSCGQHFSLAHVRDRHEQTIHHMFRRKAHRLNPRRTSQPASSSTTRRNAPITIIVWSPSTNSSQVQSPSTADAPGGASRTRPGSPADMEDRRRNHNPYPRSTTPIPSSSLRHDSSISGEATRGDTTVNQHSSRRGLRTPEPAVNHRAVRAWAEVTRPRTSAPPVAPLLSESAIWGDESTTPNTRHQRAGDERHNPQVSWTNYVSPSNVSYDFLLSFSSHAAAAAHASQGATENSFNGSSNTAADIRSRLPHESVSSSQTFDNGFRGLEEQAASRLSTLVLSDSNPIRHSLATSPLVAATMSVQAGSPDMYNRVAGVYSDGPQNSTNIDPDLLFIFLTYRNPTNAPPTGHSQSYTLIEGGDLSPRHHPATGMSHSVPERTYQADVLPQTHLQVDISNAAGANSSHVSDHDGLQWGRRQNSSQMPQTPRWDQILHTLSTYERSQSPRTIADSASLSWNGSSHTYSNNSFQQ
ncbi:hypothetical protein M408DRAFT_295972 [Serendipita vermifera MAFF 305830]|uniref:C2H2-type domain-containing protein n=1 Tax=Serendipita vermifera MAFF 305830 TaxID=933852 RepID=A0A0C3BFM1_SERVB|nr:hypothetical protein M408DRAFT_295972 [Serendipita vermifera MAFF 305830]